MKAKGGYQDCVHSDQIVLVIVRRGGWIAEAVTNGKPRGTNESSPLRRDGSGVVRWGRLDCKQ
jgi:hypothetical protein